MQNVAITLVEKESFQFTFFLFAQHFFNIFLQCMAQYVTFEVMSGSYDISCPDPDCENQGVLQLAEVENLAGKDVSEKHGRFRLNTGEWRGQCYDFANIFCRNWAQLILQQ
jgi:hypothetical protein